MFDNPLIWVVLLALGLILLTLLGATIMIWRIDVRTRDEERKRRKDKPTVK